MLIHQGDSVPSDSVHLLRRRSGGWDPLLGSSVRQNQMGQVLPLKSLRQQSENHGQAQRTVLLLPCCVAFSGLLVCVKVLSLGWPSLGILNLY